MTKPIAWFKSTLCCLVLTICTPAVMAQQNLKADAPIGSADEEAVANDLPDLVKCCPLSTISLAQASATESLKHEALPVPPNEAADYLQSQGSQSAAFSHATPTLSYSSGLHSSGVYFQPLYFEDPNLERCGTGHGIATELVSAVRFFGRAPLIPYLIGSQHPHRCVQSLGDCKVCHRYGKAAYLPKLNAKGVAFQTAATLGLVFLFP
ncbi:MAG: hypothetical protein ABJZ55_23275 [Fuerstiella sp.]